MSDKPNIDYGWQSKDEPFFRKLQEINAPDVIGTAAPMPTVKDLMEALARFREVMMNEELKAIEARVLTYYGDIWPNSITYSRRLKCRT